MITRTAGLTLAMSIALLTTAQASEPPAKANDLLRVAVANEKQANIDEYYAWIDHLQKPRGSVTKMMVNTPHGILSRTLAVNDRALSSEDRQQDDERGNRLLDPQRMRDKASKQREDQEHIEHLLLALPDAFNCEYATAPDDHDLKLLCAPNPRFSPPNYETQVLQGMNAVVVINRDEKRISYIEGTLFKDVTFGWGFIGKLNRGGHIEITQSKVGDRNWRMTKMKLTFDGRILVVKPLHIEQTEISKDYRKVPRMTVAQALEYMRNSRP